MSNILPASRPQMKKEEVIAKIMAAHPDFKIPDFFICGIRGYYEDTMGAKGKNDRGIYDDAFFLIGKNEFHAFNGNTDPAVFRLAMATLKPGIYKNVWMFALHKGKYLALCQRGNEVTVTRDGKAGEFTGYFGINNHKGGINGTSSEGCQTIPDKQWPEYIATAQAMALKYYGAKYKELGYTYVLLA